MAQKIILMERGLFCCLGGDADVDDFGEPNAAIARWQSLKVIADEAHYRNTLGQLQTMREHRPAILEAIHGLIQNHNYSLQTCQQEIHTKRWPFHCYAVEVKHGCVAIDPSDPYKQCAFGVDVFIGTHYDFETFIFTTVGCSIDENANRLRNAGFIKE
jgi:hypothetical protein